MITDGARVSYVGTPAQGDLVVGDEGQVLTATSSYAHVLWATGARLGQVDMVDNSDLVPAPQVVEEPGLLDDSLDVPGVRLSVREVFEAAGESGVLGVLDEVGALAVLSRTADEATEMVAGRVRIGLGPMLAQLDADEAAAVVSTATAYLIRQALGGAGG